MKVVIAVDSFKGSLSSMEAGRAAKAGILAARPDASVIIKPLADGGEGTTDALIEGLGGRKIAITVTGPMGHPVPACYGYLSVSSTAVIEMAAAAGITLVPPEDRNPLTASTYGVGEIIQDAVLRGCRNFIIGIGGSVTNDGGIGMLKALGFRFLDKDGRDAGEGGQALGKIMSIDTQGCNPLLAGCRFQVACDVTNPLFGKNGATYIYGPQKGVTEGLLDKLDKDMAHYAAVTAGTLGSHYAKVEGAGAAGGLGFAFLSYLGASLSPGIDLVLDAVGLREELADADIVVTGEGCLDAQTAMGKAPAGVARLAKEYGIKVIAFAGCVTKEASACIDAGIDAYFPVIRGVTTLEEAMKPDTARENITAAVEQVFRLLDG